MAHISSCTGPISTLWCSAPYNLMNSSRIALNFRIGVRALASGSRSLSESWRTFKWVVLGWSTSLLSLHWWHSRHETDENMTWQKWICRKPSDSRFQHFCAVLWVPSSASSWESCQEERCDNKLSCITRLALSCLYFERKIGAVAIGRPRCRESLWRPRSKS